jgi:hypothetical protein
MPNVGEPAIFCILHPAFVIQGAYFSTLLEQYRLAERCAGGDREVRYSAHTAKARISGDHTSEL